MACLKDSMIQGYLAEFTAIPLHHTVESHLARCGRCRDAFDRVARANRRVFEWLSKLTPASAPAIDIASARERLANRIGRTSGLFVFATSQRTDPRAIASSFVVQSAIVAVLMLLGTAQVVRQHRAPVSLIAPPPRPRMPTQKTSAGGGGQHTLPRPVAKGAPKVFTQPLVTIEHPALVINPGVVAPTDGWDAPMDTVGNPLGSIHGIDGIGGLGPGNGNKAGPGIGDDAQIAAIGPGVSRPEVILRAEPEYSEEARKAKYSGSVWLSVIVDTDGTATSIRVVRSLGMGLDEKAIEAIRKWRFRPAMSNGKPVRVHAQIEINFRLL